MHFLLNYSIDQAEIFRDTSSIGSSPENFSSIGSFFKIHDIGTWKIIPSLYSENYQSETTR